MWRGWAYTECVLRNWYSCICRFNSDSIAAIVALKEALLVALSIFQEGYKNIANNGSGSKMNDLLRNMLAAEIGPKSMLVRMYKGNIKAADAVINKTRTIRADDFVTLAATLFAILASRLPALVLMRARMVKSRATTCRQLRPVIVLYPLYLIKLPPCCYKF